MPDIFTSAERVLRYLYQGHPPEITRDVEQLARAVLALRELANDWKNAANVLSVMPGHPYDPIHAEKYSECADKLYAALAQLGGT